MSTGDRVPVVTLGTAMRDVVSEISSKKLGMTCVVDTSGRLAGVITDGDLRRHMLDPDDLRGRSAADVMTSNPVTITRATLAAEALHILEQRKITSIVVVDGAQKVEGVVHLHDLWRTEMF